MEHESHTTETHTTETTTSGANPALNGLAIVGFIALLVLGIMLAIYAVRYLPTAVSKLGFHAATTTTPSLTVVNGGAKNSLPFSDELVATTTTIGATHMPPSQYPASAPAANSAPAASHSAPRLYGLPDLSVQIVSTGYLANGSNESFVPSIYVPAGARAAVQFTITNTSTNSTGPWGFIAQLPNASGYTFTSPIEQNMNPGDHILYTLGFDQANPQPGPQVVTVVADPNNQLPETNEGNNSASAAFQIGY